MKYDWLDSYLLAKPGVEKDYQTEWEADRYLIRGKMFAMTAVEKAGRPIFTFKLPPALGLLLRGQYPEAIIPGYYMNKVHWNTLYLECDVPDEVVRDMADQSYEVLLGTLSKKVQAEMRGL